MTSFVTVIALSAAIVLFGFAVAAALVKAM
jgi:hypothetical protein